MSTIAQIINTEITTDPLQRGYAALVSAQDWQSLASLLNTGTGGTLQSPTMPRSAFQLAILPAVLALASATTTIQGKWKPILAIINSAETIALTDPGVQAMTAMAVSDGLLTSQQAASIGLKPATRLQVLSGLFGYFTTPDEVMRSVGS